VKKKKFTTFKDEKDWADFAEQPGYLFDKDGNIEEKNLELDKIQKLDLHGFSLTAANKVVKKFIIESFNDGYKKLLIITGKGLRSKSYHNPYNSEKLSVLKYSVPEYINNNENLINKISKISEADIRDGGEGAICIFLKNNKKFIK